jgi:hypothetical protein
VPAPKKLTKKQLVAGILKSSKTTNKSAARKKLMAMTVAQLTAVHAKAVPAAKRTSTKKGQPRKTSRPAYVGLKAKGKRKSVKKVPDSWKKRAAKLQRAIASKKIAAKGGIAKPSDYKTGDAYTKYKRFLAKYKGVTVSSRRKSVKGKSKKAAPAGMKSVYRGISLKSKKPYYLSKGYRVKSFAVGGGPTGAGTVRKVSGSAGQPFKKMTSTQQRAVCTFLNTAQGSKMRGPGAPKKANCSSLVAKATKPKATKKRTSKRRSTKKKASANRWW